MYTHWNMSESARTETSAIVLVPKDDGDVMNEARARVLVKRTTS